MRRVNFRGLRIAAPLKRASRDRRKRLPKHFRGLRIAAPLKREIVLLRSRLDRNFRGLRIAAPLKQQLFGRIHEVYVRADELARARRKSRLVAVADESRADDISSFTGKERDAETGLDGRFFLGFPLVAPVGSIAALGAAVFGLLGFVAHDLPLAAQR